MNKDKRITFRVSSEEYEKIKKKVRSLDFQIQACIYEKK